MNVGNIVEILWIFFFFSTNIGNIVKLSVSREIDGIRYLH
jgi:hypothetical protein